MRRHSLITRAMARCTLPGLTLAVWTGCHSIGPGTIPRDRFDYSAALADSWKSMMLLNVVKARFLDMPLFLDVGQVVSGYTLETSGSVGGSVAAVGAPSAPGNSLTLGGAARFSQQPTITYTPLTGDKFLEGFLTPIDPAKVFSLIQAGYAADFVVQLTVESLNGLRNRPVSLASKRNADPEFFRVLSLLREIQEEGALGFKVERPTNNQPATVLFFRSDKIPPETQTKAAEVRKLLGLPLEGSSFRLIFSPLRGNSGELGVETRSLWQILSALSMGVELPPKHLERKLAPPLSGELDQESSLLNIHSGPTRPPDTYAAVPYEGQWFWIANDDWRSKRTFSSILFLVSLVESGGAQTLPALTIPTR